MTFMYAAAIGAGGSILSGLLSSKGASSAANTQANAATEAAKIQAASADKSLALQERMYKEQVARNQPYVNSGSLAQNRLMSMLGLQADPRYAGSQPQSSVTGGGGFVGGGAMGATMSGVNSLINAGAGAGSGAGISPTMQTRDQMRQQLLAQYTTPATQGAEYNAGIDNGGYIRGPGTPASVDEAGLNTAIDQLYGQQQAQQQQWQAGQNTGGGQVGTIEGNDPYYNQYANGYQAAPDLMVGNYQSPGDFDMSKFQQDPGYAFRMSEGLKALDRTAAARGDLISGGAMKGAMRYGQDMASQEYQNAFNRYGQNREFNSNLFNQNRSYQTGQYNQNRNFNTDLYKMNRSDALTPLGSLMSSGQNAANQMGSAGQNYASNAGSTFQNAGNAAANGINAAGQAGAMGQMGAASIQGNTLNNMASSYSQANMLNALRGSTPMVAPRGYVADTGGGYGTLYGGYDSTLTANRIGMN